MKILFSSNYLRDIINFRGNVIEYLVKQGFDVVLVAPPCDPAIVPPFSDSVKVVQVPMQAKGTNPLNDLKYFRALKKIYVRERPDYIFHYTIKPNIYGTLAAKALGIRSSAMIAGLGHVYSSNGAGSKLARVMYKYAMRYPERVMVLNQANYDTLLENRVVASDKLILLEGGEGVDLARFPPLQMPGNDRPVFLMICRMLYEKGYAEYRAAAEALRGQAEFRIMGSLDPHPSAVPRAVIEADAARGAIRYIEFSPEVLSQMAQADCIVLPSYSEGLSRVLMEGLAVGRPIVTTDIAGCRETVRDGVNGFLCIPKNTESLIEAMQKIIALSPGQRAEMGNQSRKLAERAFDVEKVTTIYSQIIEPNEQ